jgi:hypothetical protein
MVLRAHEGTTRALYDATVTRGSSTWSATVEIHADVARVVTATEGFDPTLARQLEAIARTLGRRADAAPWPRRIARWREPGVR